MIYADNAATTKLDIDAYEAMLPFLRDDYSNPSQKYSFSANARKALSEAREIIASCINAEPDEIFFTSGGTESDNWAIKGVAEYYGKSQAILCSNIEHHAVINTCEALEGQGYPVAYISSNNDGIVSENALKNIIHSPSVVSIMMVNNEIGTIQPIRELAEIAHEHNALFHTDAVQAVGHIPVDVKNINVDLLSASAHKFNGPHGTGFLYIKQGTKILPLLNGGLQESGYRAGTENVAGIVAMAVALKKNCDNIEKNNIHIDDLFKALFSTLKVEYSINGSEKDKYAGIYSVSFNGASGESLFHLLDLKGICVSTGAACNSVSTQISHVLSAIKISDERAKSTIRISLGKDNSIEDAIMIAETLNSLISRKHII